jgi:hypothetical protein
MVSYVRSNFYAGEDFRDLDDCRSRAEQWCRDTAGMRIHGTTRLRPAEVFAADELPGECLRILGYLVAGHNVAKTAPAKMPSRTSVDTIDRMVLVRWRRLS